ncbi:ferredoxin--NADP(+) reductase [Providencia rettgeri]|uniref:Flavodoxin/ferredoxin--NADP reductase n=1 Tax=Providencia rettgeri TaxID=587 RepID=A0AB35LDN2_PRORE|nr:MULTISPECIES: ferredoxin--NADP(+) reductase [Providencia]ELR5297331.1 ferredoxin--NADP(+) reductase [Providencia rettgeri]MBG5902003.1 ferredoxin--NADP(+) reductase [Providencia rettgeri]MBG5932644.1 ferredoxin--NADP(+) reductase [Providencia rettgeri]MBI6194364.1 ferredoxin--NADP(+) reductase [Providencia rettgeri]MBQ0340368.1 ferredoxin--NADP(+) reductase [Providencia rettgeri]
MANWVTGTVTEAKFWTDSLFSLVIKAPIKPFTAGQYAKLGLEIEGERVQRAYSYVNAPSDDRLEFYFVIVPGGKLSPKLAKLKPNDTLQITDEATGFFVLDEIPPCKNLWMLSTGTAIGPFLSILQEGKDLERFEKIVLLHAVRYEKDLSYLPLMKTLEQQYQGKLKIVTVVSREHCANSLHGRVPALIECHTLEDAVGLTLSPETCHVMLCGNPEMVRDTRDTLKNSHQMVKHLRRKPGHISSEQYW